MVETLIGSITNYAETRILPAESQRNTTDPSVAVTDSLVTDYDSADESLVCSTFLPPLKKLDGVEPISGPKTIKSILKLKSTFKAETLKGVIINEPSSAPTKDNKSSLASKVNSAPAGKLKSVKIKDDPPLVNVMKELNNLKLQFSKNQSSYSRNTQPQQVTQNALQNKYKTQFKKSCDLCGLNNHLSENCYKVLFCKRIISLEREINLRNPQHAFKICKSCGSSTHTTTDHYDIEWFKRGKALQAKKAKALKSTRKPIWYLDSGCSRHMTGVKSYLQKYVEQSGPKVVFGDDSTCTTKGYGSIKYLELTTSTLLKLEDIHMMNIFILMNLLKVSSDQNGQADQNDQSAQIDEILNDDMSEHSNQTNDEQIIYNLPNTKDIQIPEHLSSTDKEDTSVQNTIPIPNPSSSIPSMGRLAPQDRWYQDKHIELVNIIGNPGAGVLIRAMAKELSTASAHECLFVDFQSEEEPKKVFEALKHPRWVDAMQDELNQFSRNKVWRLVLAPFGKTIIGSKWIKQSESGISINQENYIKDLLKKYDINGSSVKTPMVPPNNLGPDLSDKAVNETRYRGMIRSLMYLTASRPNIQFPTCLCAKYQANPKESHFIAVKRIFKYLKVTSSLGLWYPKYLSFDLKEYSDSDYAGCNMDRKSTFGACQLLGGKLVCWSAKK
ncbi:hypothetical protein Tco_0168581 [Tanacetum coccineum]